MHYWQLLLHFSPSLFHCFFKEYMSLFNKKFLKKGKVTISKNLESFHENMVQRLCHDHGNGEPFPLALPPAASFRSWYIRSWGCHNQGPQAGGLDNRHHLYLLTVLQAGTPRLRCQQNCFSLDLSWLVDGCHLPVPSHGLPLCMSVSQFPRLLRTLV